MPSKLKVNMISESVFTVQGHGVHTAYIENLNCLKARDDVDIMSNTNRKADIVHIQTVGPYSLRKLLARNGKKIVSAHVTPDSFVGSLIGAKYWYFLAKLYLRWFYNRADGVFAVSTEVQDELRRLGVKKPIFLMPNTIDTTRYHHTASQRQEARKALGVGPDQFVVISVGQVQPRKRVDSFVAAAKALPQAKFIWIGGVPFKKLAAEHKEMEQVMAHSEPNVGFTGVITQDKVLPYYFAADAFFLPSEQETFGLVVVEAAAADLPVLLRDLAQYRVTFKGDYLSATSDEGFIAELKKLQADKAYYQKAVTAAAKIAALYDSRLGSERILEAYRSTLGTTVN